MRDPVIVNVVQRLADAERDPHRALGGQFPLLAQDLAQQAPLDPLHHQVDPAAAVLCNDLHHAGMVEFLSNVLFAMEALEENGVALHFGVGDLDGDRAAGQEVSAAEDGGHAASRDDAFDAVMVELVARVEWSH